jgi:hypothetical protein
VVSEPFMLNQNFYFVLIPPALTSVIVILLYDWNLSCFDIYTWAIYFSWNRVLRSISVNHISIYTYGFHVDYINILYGLSLLKLIESVLV